MAIITADPIVLTDCIISLDGSDFADAISAATLTPSASTVTFKGLKAGSSFTGVTSATWTLDLTFAQDWTTSGALAPYLFENEGDTVAAILKPQSGVGPSFEMDVIITPGAVGGSVDQVPTSTVTLGVKSKPTLVPAA